MIKYIGSKRRLISNIVSAVRSSTNGKAKSVIDLFSGTSRVGHALKREGCRVLSNDVNAYAATLARCYVQADREDVLRDTEKLVREFNSITGDDGYFTETFCVRSRFFQPKNGARVDAIRESIARKGLEPELESVLLVSLMEAADRIDSTVGVQMAYLKAWASRSNNDLELRVPDVLPKAAHGKGKAMCMEAIDAASVLVADVAYLDPPYNQHTYLGNYHIWESLVLWDKPEVYGVACKRIDVRTRQSPFNSKRKFAEVFEKTLQSVRAPVIIVSFNNEGYITRSGMEAVLGKLWNGNAKITTIEYESKRYVGAQIGIYNPLGEKVGKVSHLRNTEYLYVASAH